MKKEVKKKAVKDPHTEEIKRYLGSLSEDFQHKVSAIGEQFFGLNNKIDRIDLRLARVEEEVLGLRLRLGNIESSNEEMKTELGLIRHNQVTRDELKYLESRVLRLEKAKR